MNRVREQIGLSERLAASVTGAGVTAAVLDSGVSMHPDLKGRIAEFRDFVSQRNEPYDNNGHGTHICGILCGSGALSAGRYRGIAPGMKLVVGKVLNNAGKGQVEVLIRAIQWVIQMRRRYGIRILNISIGTKVTPETDYGSRLIQTVEEAWENGIVVVVAAGNNGPLPESVTTPGIAKKVITVGACDDSVPVWVGGRRLQNYSGRGSAKMRKPEVVAPAQEIVSLRRMVNYKYRLISDAYEVRSGTSMAAPVVAGAVALLLETNPALTPEQVKSRLQSGCVDLGLPVLQQGYGKIWLPKFLNPNERNNRANP